MTTAVERLEYHTRHQRAATLEDLAVKRGLRMLQEGASLDAIAERLTNYANEAARLRSLTNPDEEKTDGLQAEAG